jgi:hypothetical protein
MTGIAVQLYSLRQQIAEVGLERVLERVAAMGMVASSAHVTLPVGDQAAAVLDPSVFMEVDVYWAQVGGTVGAGRVDIGRVLAAGPGPEWHVVELDELDGDMFEAVAESQRGLARWHAEREQRA